APRSATCRPRSRSASGPGDAAACPGTAAGLDGCGGCGGAPSGRHHRSARPAPRSRWRLLVELAGRQPDVEFGPLARAQAVGSLAGDTLGEGVDGRPGVEAVLLGDSRHGAGSLLEGG